ncbi:dehydrogenase [Microbacterium sorbitolivorans]|uniref:Gfo/Idh/MocA family oxidoreductase n=1 Tax=Microbacterium sorbitolivorans TaxID=1867410 RepID=A0A367Y874_9MICO|nr:Gfo/Idh/MocA family oxidoreductase [Microbacterium sorbitolivorans]RCK62073.1 gfo/Idh/MocA family oxidoreductase [Microbacterium sorbitolivorans]GGF43408.1 dehydrogenase [Microbacterium sorbitolivorans]
MTTTRYALVGTGHRAEMYVDAITDTYRDIAELVALCDPNAARAAYYVDRMSAKGVAAPSVWGPDDLEAMIRDEKIDRVIIASRDDTHAGLIVRCLDAGVDVMVEKPLTVNAESAAAIEDAVARTGRNVVVTFNYRYSPRNSALREVIQSGRIGKVTSIDFSWMLDTKHGADYFRRWHRDKANAGGLLVHKSSHHFDLVNWWIASEPRRVFASGALRFYGSDNAAERGLAQRPERGTHDGSHDAFELDLRDDPRLEALYLGEAGGDGYVRDRDVFTDGITIEDNLALIVDYASGATLSYSLNAHAPWEGYRVAVNGTEGRVELDVVERGSLAETEGLHPVLDPSYSAVEAGSLRPVADRLILQRHWEEPVEIDIASGPGGHGGGDALLLRDLFVGPGEDPLARPADWTDGVRSIAVGIAGNISLETGLPVKTAELGIALLA